MMGSFSEVSLSFYLREDTPDEVLATFSALVRPSPEDYGERPRLPAPVVEPMDVWSPDYADSGPGALDPFGSTSWRHDWASWLTTSMGYRTVPDAALMWNATMRQWHLSSRCSWKTAPDTVLETLRWLGAFVAGQDDEWRPAVLVRSIDDDNAARPYLLWARSGDLSMEDLNPPDEWCT